MKEIAESFKFMRNFNMISSGFGIFYKYFFFISNKLSEIKFDEIRAYTHSF